MRANVIISNRNKCAFRVGGMSPEKFRSCNYGELYCSNCSANILIIVNVLLNHFVSELLLSVIRMVV